MKTKIILWSVVLVLAGTSQRSVAEQVITLDDGTKLTFLGLTTGTRQMAPGYENLSTANWLYLSTNTSVVWIKEEYKPGKRPSYELLVYDRTNTGCVNIEPRRPGSHVKNGVDVQGFVLDAFPRWDKETILRVRPYYGIASKEQFVMTNPAPGIVANWTPEPLPSTKSDGDLEVTLTKLIAGAPAPYRQGSDHPPTTDPANQCVHLDFDFRENGQSTTNWQPWPVRTFDAFGNQVRGLIYSYPSNGINPIYPDRIHPSFPLQYDGYFYRPGLWPDEAAWKVRMEFIRRSGFSDDEIVTFTNLPVRPGSQQDADDEWTWEASNTNFTFIAEAKVNGVNLKLLQPLLVPDSNSAGQKHIRVLIFADPNFNPQGMNLTVLQATDDQEHNIWSPLGSPWAGHYSLELPNVREIKTLNLKLALHKSRFVDFTVKPTKQ